MKTHLDLFSGIGGFALAASWADFQTIGFCEYEDYPSRVLSARFPGVPIHGDIRELDGEQYRGVSLITGGFPCQPFSVAGKQAGKADDRYLWPEMLRVIAQAQPNWVVAENVTGIVSMELDQVLTDLEGEGYACGTVIVPACAVDAPHRRDRVWIIAEHVGDSTSWGRSAYWSQPRSSAERMGERQANKVGSPSPYVAHSQCQSVRGEGSGQDVGETSSLQGEIRERQRIRVDASECSKDVANANSQRLQRQRANGSQEGRQEPPKRPAGLCNGTPSPNWWEVEPPVGRVANGVSKRVDRLKGLGNAIVPQVAYEILRLLTEK